MDARGVMLARVLAECEADARIVGVVDYGSGSEGRADAWSDVDLALFVRDGAFDAFVAGWKAWAARFGRLLLAYVGGVGHPWAVYDAEPLPLRVDFAVWRESDAEIIRTWPNSPLASQAMVRYDATGGVLTAHAQTLVGQSLAPLDPAATFEKVSGDFWYYVLRTYSRLPRGDLWAARHDFTFILLGNLFALLRLEAGKTDRWRASSSAVGVERDLAPERLAQLDALIPGPGEPELRRAMLAAIDLGQKVCESIHRQHGWLWPQQVALRARLLLSSGVDT